MDVTDGIINEFFPENNFSSRKRRIIEWLIGLNRMNPYLDCAKGKRGIEWVETLMESLRIRCETHCGDYQNIPEKGPVVVVSNHPTVMDGIVMINSLAVVRKDIKIVANHVLTTTFPEIESISIGIRNMQGKMSRRQLKEMNDHLKNNGLLLIFPAGRLASITPLGLKESPWLEGFLRLASKNNAAIVPAHIRGRNSLIYYITALIWRPLSNLMIFRECVRHKDKTLRVRIFPQINLAEAEKNIESPLEAQECRHHLLQLAKNRPAPLPMVAPVARPENKGLLAEAVEKCELLETLSSGKKLFLYRFNGEGHSPVLSELGRLREVSFRATGVGTGKKRDNDVYDFDYYHIFLWDPQKMEIAGAYRLMLVGEQLAAKGLNGLYSSTLFNYTNSNLPLLNKSIEIGRGFVQQSYQKTNALDSLWKGIFRFASRYPEYENLIGVLTIPRSFTLLAQQIIVAFYRLWFSPDEKMASENEFLINDSAVNNFFLGKDFQQDWSILNAILKEQGCELPWPYKQAAKWYQPGGSKIFSFVEDKTFNSVAGLNVCNIENLKRSYYAHFITRKKAS